MRQARHRAARAGQYGVGASVHAAGREGSPLVEEIVDKAIADEGLQLLGWRDVPVETSDLGDSVKATEPLHRQVFIGKGKASEDQEAFERQLFLARKVISNAVYNMKDPRTAGYYPVCLSSRTIVYKGMVLVHQLGELLPRPAGPALRQRAGPRPPALRHQHVPDLAARASLPHGRPQRRDQHAARQRELDGGAPGLVDSELFGDDISKIWPISYEGQSDTACFDNALEFLVRGGYSLRTP